jgi:hypothetical protein
MVMRRLSVGLLVVAAALAAAFPAAGKEGVKATLATPVPLNAEPGTKLEVVWRLAFLDEHGRRQAFGAGGVFVRLLSASGAGAKTGLADERGPGEYAATVVVPKGGIGDVRIGIRSWTNGPSGTRESDWLLPITNDPLPGPAHINPTATGKPGNPGSRVWILIVAGCGLFTVALVGLVAARRRRVLPA